VWPDASIDQLLHGGEEYELLIAAPELPTEIEGISVTRIGETIPIGAAPQIHLVDGAREIVVQPRGYQHFQ
jgi:thiamine monophosphate kinase